MFTTESAPKILSEEQIAIVHEQAMRILEEIGTDVLHEQARKLLGEAGASVDDERVRWDRAFVMEQVAKAPRTFRLLARNPERSLTVGNGTPVYLCESRCLALTWMPCRAGRPVAPTFCARRK